MWESMSTPAIFSLIGETLRRSRGAIGFSSQSILRKIPIIIVSPIGGYLIEVYGINVEIKIGFTVSIVLTILAIIFQRKYYTEAGRVREREAINVVELWREIKISLKKLLPADIMARLASNTIKVYVVLYVSNVIGASPVYYGLMISIQMITSISSSSKLADIYGRKIFVTLTFTFFTLFPVSLTVIP